MCRRRHFLIQSLIANLAIIAIALTSYFSTSAVSGSSNSWTRTGPVVGTVDALAISTSNPSIVYAGITSSTGGFGQTSTSGIYKSTDGGSNWTRSGLIGKSFFSLAVDPTDPDKVYAGTRSSGVYKSTDGGTSWSGPFIGNSDIFSLAVDPNQPSILYCSPIGQGLLKSIDSGVTWNLISSGSNLLSINSIAIDASNSNIIYLSGGTTPSRGVYKTTNAGVDWVVSNTGIPNSTNSVTALTLSPSNNSILYAAMGSDVYISTNAAANWTKRSAGLPNSSITNIAIDPSNASIVFAATSGQGVYKTVDGGLNWTSAGLNTIGVNTLNIEGSNSLKLYAGTRGGGVVKTIDGGLNWQQSTNRPNGNVTEILIDPSNPAIIYANNSDTLSKSTNHGKDWSFTNLQNHINVLPGFPTHRVVVDPTNPSTLYLGVDARGVFKTTDGGITWNQVFSQNLIVDALAIDPVTPTTLYLATGSVFLFKSVNAGGTWTQLNFPGLITALVVDPINPSIIYAGTGFGVMKSTNGGASWSFTALLNSGGLNPDIVSLVMDPSNPAVLYAATRSLGAFKTINGGTSWNSVFSDAGGNVLSFAIDSSAPTTVFAGTGQGVYQSSNGGLTSIALTTGWPSPGQPAMALAFDATSRNLYAGTPDGVYIYQVSASPGPTPTPTPPPTFTISGRVTFGGLGLGNVTVGVSGHAFAVLETDANGNYSLTNLAQGGSYTIWASRPNYVFSPQTFTFTNLNESQTADFAASITPGMPILISEETSTRALAFDSVFWTREPFKLNQVIPFGSDSRTRVILFATNFDLLPDETASDVTATAEDASPRLYPLVVEAVGVHPELSWLRYVVVRLHDDMGNIGDVLIRIKVHNMFSNRVRIGMGHTGGGPPDDQGAVPTPGRPPG